mmetsp:Transcript_13543/g.21111  ORF Transcript_13543/g.21111 Transcript_13543/m.21111 type:complete len:153 (-) Transcript_13543:12014-12472(-)
MEKSAAEYVLQTLIYVVGTRICEQELMGKEEEFKEALALRQDYDFCHNVLSGKLTLPQGEVLPKRYLEEPELDSVQAGQSPLIKDHLIQLFKVNSLYHFQIDFKRVNRVHKLKLVFDEKNKKQQSFRMRVNISMPDEQSSSSEKPEMKVVFT